MTRPAEVRDIDTIDSEIRQHVQAIRELRNEGAWALAYANASGRDVHEWLVNNGETSDAAGRICAGIVVEWRAEREACRDRAASQGGAR